MVCWLLAVTAFAVAFPTMRPTQPGRPSGERVRGSCRRAGVGHEAEEVLVLMTCTDMTPAKEAVMEAAVRQKTYGAGPSERIESPSQEGRQVHEWETLVGKSIFYLTVAVALWFFYWLNGITCPC
jgi:hypothetical protein